MLCIEKAIFLKVTIFMRDTHALARQGPLYCKFKRYEYFGKHLDIHFRPDSINNKLPNGFKLPISQIKPTVEETWDGITAMAEAIYPEFQQTGGDDEDQFISIG